MKIRFSFVLVLLSTVITTSAQNNGEANFKQICAACHTIGKGRLVGPDLANVDQKHPEDWLIKFVKSSQSVIKSGDKYADSIFKAYNQVPMPDRPDLNDEQIKEIIAYIKTNSPALLTTAAVTDTVTAAPGSTVAPTITGDVMRGQNLFVGNIRLANNGPTCNSCHNVNKNDVLSGGVLAKDLTQSASRITVNGIKGVLAGLPFPAMKEAYSIKTLTEQEINDLAAFLKHVDEVAATQQTGNAGNIMLLGGTGGIVCLLILYSLFWYRRKKQEVNHSIYERQIKSY